MEIDERLILVMPRADKPSVATYTMATWFGHMLRTAESDYGPRDLDYTFLGFEFHAGWRAYPFHPFPRMVVIRLPQRYMTNPDAAFFCLAFEAVHMLTPDPALQITTLQEGLGTLFGSEYLALYLPASYRPDLPAEYREARRLVQALLALEPDAILKLRALEGGRKRLSTITAEEIRTVCPICPPHIADKLASPFPYPPDPSDPEVNATSAAQLPD